MTAPGLDNRRVLGTDFARTLRAAQAGEEDAFVRLWRDANPAMVRYLRVVGHDDPYDEACEGWVTVVRGLPAFSGDETAWRAWVLGCARQRAEDSTLRQAWGSSAGIAVPHVEGDLDLDELQDLDGAADPASRGINDTLTALRDLPLGQGEVVVLRLGAELPTDAVAHVVGVEEEFVQRAEVRALERLGTRADLLSWSLTAPPSPAELADERIALGAFRKVLARARAERVKVVAVGSKATSERGTGSATRGASRTGSTRRPAPAGAGARSRSAARGASVARRSRTAALALTAASLSVVSLGGVAAAAYVGVLPTPVQQALHDAVGAPAPGARDDGSSSRRQPTAPPTAGAGAPTPDSAAAGLCRAWSTDQAKGTSRERSIAFRKLVTAAGGPEKVQSYCVTALAQKPSRGAPTASVGGTSPTGSPTAPGQGQGKEQGNRQGNGPGGSNGAPAATPGATVHTPKGRSTPAQPTARAKVQPTSKATTPDQVQPTSRATTPGKGQPTSKATTPSPQSPATPGGQTRPDPSPEQGKG